MTRERGVCLAALYAVCVVGLMGCASSRTVVVHNPVGPWRARVTADEGTGQLIVYSATRVTLSDQSEYPVHTPYTILGSDDRVIRRINNTSGLFSQSPATVSLPAGEYHVKALAADTGYVVLPVIIEPQQTTIVDLDGTALPQDAHDDTDLVTLPNGRAIGASAR